MITSNKNWRSLILCSPGFAVSSHHHTQGRRLVQFRHLQRSCQGNLIKNEKVIGKYGYCTGYHTNIARVLIMLHNVLVIHSHLHAENSSENQCEIDSSGYLNTLMHRCGCSQSRKGGPARVPGKRANHVDEESLLCVPVLALPRLVL